MIGHQNVYLTFPWFSRKHACGKCETTVQHDFHLALRFVAYFFLPLYPKDVLRIYRCRTCGSEACVTSNFVVQAAWRLAIVAAVALVWLAGIAYALMRMELEPRTKLLHGVAWALFVLIGSWIATHRAKKASTSSTETREPTQRSFTHEIENGFWVVMPFLLVLALAIGFGGPQLVWVGGVSMGLKWMAFRIVLLALIFLYWLWRRLTMPWPRAVGYGLVFSAIFTDLMGRLLPLDSFLFELPVFAVTFALLMLAHYSTQTLSKHGGRDAAKLAAAMNGLRSTDGIAVIDAIETLGQMLDSRAVQYKLDEIVDCIRGRRHQATAAGLSHVPELLEALHDVHHNAGDTHALLQRECMGSRHIVLLKSTYVCCRDESLFGTKTRLISLSEIHPEPVPTFAWGAWWLKTSLIPIGLLAISTLAMLLAGQRQPVSWVVFGGAAIFCLVQGLMATGRKLLFYDRYRSHVQFALFAGRPSRSRVTEFVDALARTVRGEPMDTSEDKETPAEVPSAEEPTQDDSPAGS